MAVSRVRVTTAHRAYWPKTCQVLDLKAGDEIIGEMADHLATTGAPVEILDEVPEVEQVPVEPVVEPVEPTEPDDSPAVPDGTAADVLEWVGDDPARAAAALEAESAREKPRTTLATALERIAKHAPETPAGPAEVE